MTERMVVSETGGRKGSKPAQLSTVDPQALLILAEVGGKGAEKYEPHNYLKGYDWSLSFNAMQRHALAFWNGEDTDEESGLPHMGHAAWHALALVSFLTRELGTDDRFKQAEPTDIPTTLGDAVAQRCGEILDDAERKAYTAREGDLVRLNWSNGTGLYLFNGSEFEGLVSTRVGTEGGGDSQSRDTGEWLVRRGVADNGDYRYGGELIARKTP